MLASTFSSHFSSAIVISLSRCLRCSVAIAGVTMAIFSTNLNFTIPKLSKYNTLRQNVLRTFRLNLLRPPRYVEWF